MDQRLVQGICVDPLVAIGSTGVYSLNRPTVQSRFSDFKFSDNL